MVRKLVRVEAKTGRGARIDMGLEGKANGVGVVVGKRAGRGGRKLI